MLILLFCISILILATGLVLHIAKEAYNTYRHNTSTNDISKNKWLKLGRIAYMNDLHCVFYKIGVILFVVITTSLTVVGSSYGKCQIIDEQIAIYQEENTKIENTINEIVTNYQKYETDIFDNATKDLNPTIIFSMYPELKSDQLIIKQIEIYNENNKEIKELRKDKTIEKIFKWWLFF